MTLNEVLVQVQPSGARIMGKETDPNGDGWIVYIGKPNELVFPYAVAHCIPVHVDSLENPPLHDREADAVLRRFAAKKRPGKVE